ncbi:MAG: RNA polymerase sigma factor [Planctomycetota bacterium]|nr:RNA polymerase sigma factor [Planctomycetota bacterium]
MSPQEYRQAVHEHSNRVHSYAAWLLRDLEESRDVTQDALMKLWINHEKVVPEAARSWLLKAVYRMCIDRVRRRPPRALGRTIDLAALTPGHSPIPEHRSINEEQSRALSEALGLLPIRERALILLREVQQLSYAELSEVFEMPLGSIKGTLHRARQNLREVLKSDTRLEMYS